jgi:allophanate hydrolase subunit 2
VLEFPGDGPHGPATGCRAYLAVPGGIDAAIVLGSRSTCLAAGFGGLDGRALRAGDAVAAKPAARSGFNRPELVWPDPGDADWRGPIPATSATLRVVVGPAPGLDTVAGMEWRVGSAADRVGVRLDGEPVPDGIGGEATTQGIPWGAIQVPADGRPIVLGADHQSTGGYRVVGVVISADLPALGQLRPGSPIRLEVVDRTAALAALRGRREALVAGTTALRDAVGWGALIDSAGG